MVFRILAVSGLLILSAYSLVSAEEEAAGQQKAAVESDQQISEFSLAGYGDKGQKTWAVAGKTADIFDDVVKLNSVVGNLYGKEEIKLTADQGDFNKTDGKVHLEKNVVITTATGSKLTSDSLDWDRKNKLVSTDDQVNIWRENMVTVAKGARGEPGLKRVTLEKEVQVNINPAPEQKGGIKEKITITCDGPLEIDYGNNIATFKNNVRVVTAGSTIDSDIMDVYFISSKKEEGAAKDESGITGSTQAMANKIEKIVARGNVKIVRGENTSFSEEAIYTGADKKIVLSGKPKLIIFSTGDFKDASFGN
jgi:LPS export ABC transporter protein LptC